MRLIGVTVTRSRRELFDKLTQFEHPTQASSASEIAH